MKKLWTIIKREYLYNVRRPAFLAATFLMPLFLAGSMILGGTLGVMGDGIEDVPANSSVGYVDQADVMEADVMPEDIVATYTRYETLESAQAAIDRGEITAVFELPADYMTVGRINVYSYDNVPDVLKEEFDSVIRANLVEGVELPMPLERLQGIGDGMTMRVDSTGREISGDSVFFIFLLPMIFGMLLVISSLSTSSFLMYSLVEEKQNRVVEVLVTSVKPLQLLAGKILGLGLLGITQILIIMAMAYIGLSLANAAEFLQGLSIPLDLVLAGIVYFVLSYLILAAVLAGLGVLVGSEQESSQLSGFMTLPFFIPFFFILAIVTDPNGPTAMLMSFIPFTAPMTMMLRIGMTNVPFWQFALSVSIMAVTAMFFIWLSARVFRWGLLLYGKKFNIRNLFNALVRRGGNQVSAANTQEVEVVR